MELVREVHRYRTQQGLDQGQTVPLVFLSTINGYVYYEYTAKEVDLILSCSFLIVMFYLNTFLSYRYHYYRRRPMEGIQFMMNCEPEPTNRHDRYAVIVRAPSFVENGILDVETHPPPWRLRVRDLLGEIIGHVPRHVCNVISIGMLHRRSLERAVCFFTGETIHEGNLGPKLKCVYCLELRSFESMRESADILRLYVPEDNIYL